MASSCPISRSVTLGSCFPSLSLIFSSKNGQDELRWGSQSPKGGHIQSLAPVLWAVLSSKRGRGWVRTGVRSLLGEA